jgi:hypothetical protein
VKSPLFPPISEIAGTIVTGTILNDLEYSDIMKSEISSKESLPLRSPRIILLTITLFNIFPPSESIFLETTFTVRAFLAVAVSKSISVNEAILPQFDHIGLDATITSP